MSKIEEYLSTNPIFREAVVCYPINDNGEILLGYRQTVSNGLGKGLYSGIGGGIEMGETPEEANTREAIEEVGITFSDVERMGSVKFLFPHKPTWNQNVVIFIAKAWEGVPHVTEEGKIIPKWFHKTQLPIEDMWHDNRFWINRVIDGEVINATFLYGGSGRVEEYIIE